MVLEEATTSSSDGFADQPYPSDRDPYATNSSPSSSSSTNGTNFNINYDELPGPIPLLGPLLGFTRANRTKAIYDNLKVAQQYLSRPLSQEEMSALSYYRAKADANASYGAAIGVTGGAYRCYATADTYRFPFFKPDQTKWNFNKFVFAEGLPARMMWHGLRSCSYLSAGFLLGSFFGMNQGLASVAAGMKRDDRLKNFRAEVERHINEKNGRMEGLGTPRGQQHQQEQQQVQRQGQKNQSPWPTDSADTSAFSDDDMSPTAAGSTLYPSLIGLGTTNNTSSQTPSSQSQQQRTTSPGWSRQKDTSSSSSSSSSSFSSDENSGFPSSSPQTSDSNSASSGGGGGNISAWERIRRQSGGASSSSASQQRGNDNSDPIFGGSSNTSNNYIFPKAEEAKELPRSEAQREFDASVEQERKGLDLEEGQRRNRKW